MRTDCVAQETTQCLVVTLMGKKSKKSWDMCIHRADSLCCTVETNTTLESSYISYMLVAQSCLTLWNPIDCRLPGSSVHGILQARILEWVAIFSCRGSSRPRDWTQVSFIAGIFWATREAQSNYTPHTHKKKMEFEKSPNLACFYRDPKGLSDLVVLVSKPGVLTISSSSFQKLLWPRFHKSRDLQIAGHTRLGSDGIHVVSGDQHLDKPRQDRVE